MVRHSAGGNCRLTFIGLSFLCSVDLNAVDSNFFVFADAELLCNQIFHDLDAIDVKLGVVWRGERRNRQQCQHHAQHHER